MAPKDIHSYVEQIIGHHLHAKQVLSLANGMVGTIHSASLAIAAIVTGLAMAYGMLPTLSDEWLEPVMGAFGKVIAEHQVT